MDALQSTPNARWKLAAAVAAVMALSAPAAIGVYRALEPTRGPVAAGLAALGFELAYLSLSLLTLRAELRPQARRVALGAVITSVVLNVLADYSARVAGGLESWPQALERFDPLALGLAVVESAPLAGLAFALASLLHRLAEQPEQVEVVNHGSQEAAPLWAGPVLQATTWPRVQPAYPAPVKVEPMRADGLAAPQSAPVTAPAPTNAADAQQEAIALHLSCPNCGAPLDRARWLAARRWGRCSSCKGGPANA
jgi:hypothetical protein